MFKTHSFLIKNEGGIYSFSSSCPELKVLYFVGVMIQRIGLAVFCLNIQLLFCLRSVIIGEGDEAYKKAGDDSKDDAYGLHQGRFVLVFSRFSDVLRTDIQIAASTYFCHLLEALVVSGFRHVEKHYTQRIDVCLRV